MQTILKTNAQNMPQREIKAMKQQIERYWKSLVHDEGIAIIVFSFRVFEACFFMLKGMILAPLVFPHPTRLTNPQWCSDQCL